MEARADTQVRKLASGKLRGTPSIDSLAINPDNGKAYMHVDECWYCGLCAARCPTGAVTVNMPYLIR